MSGNSDGACSIDIHIDCHGDVNVNNCTTTDVPGTTAPSACPPPAVPCGECMPVAAGAKHKRGREEKVQTLASGNRVPSVLASAAMHMARRFLLDKPPADELETAVFAKFERRSNATRQMLSCTVESLEALAERERSTLFDASVDLDPDRPIDPDVLSTAWVRELEHRVGEMVFGNPEGLSEERPGRVRVFEPPPAEEEAFPEPQVRICRINDLRTAGFRPPPEDWQPGEVQQHCEVVWVNGEPNLSCEIRQPPGCPGNEAAGACLRVPPVATGDAVVLDGVNFFSTETTVLLVDKSATTSREVEAHVWGDLETPTSEEIDGEARLVNDCRVHDRLTFEVPEDLPPGIYGVQVKVPNITGIPALGDPLLSQVEYIAVEPPPTARFELGGERLYAKEETSPSWAGSDEVGLLMLSVPVFADLTLGEVQENRNRFGDVDSGDTRDVNRALFRNDQPIAAMSLMIAGHEVDNERAYRQQIEDWKDLFVDVIKDVIEAAGGLSAAAKYATGSWWAAAIGAAILTGTFVWSLWAPADPIMGDVIGLSALELAMLTSASLPLPPDSAHTAPDRIEVNVTPLAKIPHQYHERREYISHGADSRYELYLRYTRLA